MTSPSDSESDDVVFLRDPTLFRPPPSNVQCGEIWTAKVDGSSNGNSSCPDNCEYENEYDQIGSVLFWIQLSKEQRRLEFRCRRGSVGVLEEHEIEPQSSTQSILEEATYEQVDPQFFDPGYTLAGATGFQIWAGTRLLIETLLVPQETDCPRLQEIQRHFLLCDKGIDDVRQQPTKRILELGAGIGVVGISLAAKAIDAEVILTDLPSLIENVTQWNLYANRKSINETTSSTATTTTVRDWFPTEPVPVGERNGWATTMALDWRIPIHEQLPLSVYSNVDYIVASDCVWLVSMLDSLFDTVAAIFEASSSSSRKYATTTTTTISPLSLPTLLLSFQRRDTFEGDDSPNFTTVQRVISSILARGWTVECLAWRPVEGLSRMDEDIVPPVTKSDLPSDEEKEVFVFAIQPSSN